MDKKIEDFIYILEEKLDSLEPNNQSDINETNVYEIKSSIYVIQDTQIVLEMYLKYDFNQISFKDWLEKKAFCYLSIYGIIQALYIQQDAFNNICKIFNVSKHYRDNTILSDIRNIRNDSIGHPANRYGNNKHFVSQTSVSHFCFEYLKTLNGKTEIKKVNIKNLINNQISEIYKIIKKIEEKLEGK